jgi:hypothetical protein
MVFERTSILATGLNYIVKKISGHKQDTFPFQTLIAAAKLLGIKDSGLWPKTYLEAIRV